MTRAGRLVIMGSGETAPTMVKPHRMLLESVPADSAVLLDTPYGFQQNADDITARARHYFKASVGHEVSAAGWRSAEIDGLARERALTAVRAACWVFAGPGSPTYALRAWRNTALPGVLRETVSGGGTLVFASAAALTLGSHTVPVYEIYKAGIAPYWEPGLDLVAELTGLPAVVIPRYDNAEGGHYDTRFCYLGEARLAALETELPDEALVLGVDEHTAVVLDVGAGTVRVLGNGALTIRRRGLSTVHASGSEVRLADLALDRNLTSGSGRRTLDAAHLAGSGANPPFDTAQSAGSGANRPPVLWSGSPSVSLRAAVDQCRSRFSSAIQGRDIDAGVDAVLNLEQAISDWADDTLSSADGEHAHGLLRSMVVELGELASLGAADPADLIRPYVDLLVTLRDRARAAKDFAASDEIRDFLTSAGVQVRDTPQGTAWSRA
jgi:cyanophycinase-like exopeptidase